MIAINYKKAVLEEVSKQKNQIFHQNVNQSKAMEIDEIIKYNNDENQSAGAKNHGMIESIVKDAASQSISQNSLVEKNSILSTNDSLVKSIVEVNLTSQTSSSGTQNYILFLQSE
jgi:hypothetical protein